MIKFSVVSGHWMGSKSSRVIEYDAFYMLSFSCRHQTKFVVVWKQTRHVVWVLKRQIHASLCSHKRQIYETQETTFYLLPFIFLSALLFFPFLLPKKSRLSEALQSWVLFWLFRLTLHHGRRRIEPLTSDVKPNSEGCSENGCCSCKLRQPQPGFFPFLFSPLFSVIFLGFFNSTLRFLP